ncbi:MAG: isochorismate synthase [Lysobacter sp.]
MNAVLQPSPVDVSDALLAQFRPGDSLFSSARSQLHARGRSRSLHCSADDGLVAEAAALLAGVDDGAGSMPLIGAIPFSASAPAQLWMPLQAVFASGQARHRGMSTEPPRPGGRLSPAAQMLPAAEHFKRNVADALRRIDAGELDKVVMSRSVRVAGAVDVGRLLGRLLTRGADGYTFAIDLADDEDDRRLALVGASPELLLSRRGGTVRSNPLAGSIARAADPDEDRRRAAALLASAKDRHEHALVVAAVRSGLAPYCCTLDVPASPSLLATPTMWHLSTPIRGELSDPAVGSLQLALALHPTPAVCGHPTASARALIGELEGFDRGLFTGLVGWCDASGDGEWAVTIRCALVDHAGATVYAGAGVVAGSQPDAELAETSAKLRTMLGAMGLAEALA